MRWLAIAVGGAMGSMARHAVHQFVHVALPDVRFPVGIAIVNVVGCFAVGLLAGLVGAARVEMSAQWREFVFVGLLGGFTTFSAFGLDTFLLARSPSTVLAVANVTAQVGGGLLAVWAGYQLATSA